MVGTRAQVLLAEATREVQVAEHILTETFPMAKDPKLLLSVVIHIKRALEKTGYAIDSGKPVVMTINESSASNSEEAADLYTDLQKTMNRYRESPTVFSRHGKFIIASEGFSYLKELTEEELNRAMITLKTFVYEAGKQIMVGEWISKTA